MWSNSRCTITLGSVQFGIYFAAAAVHCHLRQHGCDGLSNARVLMRWQGRDHGKKMTVDLQPFGLINIGHIEAENVRLNLETVNPTES